MAEGEHGRAATEHKGAASEYKGAEREQVTETGLSARAKRQGLSQQAVTCCAQFEETIYIYSNLQTQ